MNPTTLNKQTKVEGNYVEILGPPLFDKENISTSTF